MTLPQNSKIINNKYPQNVRETGFTILQFGHPFLPTPLRPARRLIRKLLFFQQRLNRMTGRPLSSRSMCGTSTADRSLTNWALPPSAAFSAWGPILKKTRYRGMFQRKLPIVHIIMKTEQYRYLSAILESLPMGGRAGFAVHGNF